MSSSSRRTAALIALGAVTLTASYPPLSLPLLGFIAVAPAVVLLRQCEREEDFRRTLRWGFWYGFASQGLVLYWLVVALWHFTPLSALGYLATICLFGLWTAALFWFVVRVRVRLPALPLWVVFPVVWTAVEWGIGHQGDIRFPWLGLGTSLASAPVLVQWADFAGARGVTLWVAWCNVVLVEAFLPDGNSRRAVIRRLLPAVVSLALVAGYGVWRMRTLPLRELGPVGLVQPNEGFWEKWNPAHADSVVGKLLDMSRRLEARGRLDLLVWPEAAIPGYFVDHPQWDAAVAQLARETRTPLLTGGLDAEFHADRSYDYFNAAFFYDSTGNRRVYPVYDKHYLVPIVERVPFLPPKWFRLKWFGGFGKGRRLPLYPTAIGEFGVLICYESAFEDMPRRYRRLGADFLVNITNDKWYGLTAGPYQHAAHLILRAIETRMGIARAANSGISEFVDPLGRPYAATGIEREALVADHLRTSGVTPLYVRLGDWVGLLSVIGTLVLGGGLFVMVKFDSGVFRGREHT